MDEQDSTDWRAVASEYRKRLHGACFCAAFAMYVGSAIFLSKLLDLFRVSNSWAEIIWSFAWLPLGAAAWWVNIRLQDRADRGLRRP